MVSTNRDRLLDEDAVSSLKERLVLKAALTTPNMAEAEMLTGLGVENADDMEAAGRALVDAGAAAALITGGHLDGEVVCDVLVSNDGVERLEAPRIKSTNTHGTGCTLASAIATGLAQGAGLRDAIIRAREYVFEAIRTAPGYGGGHGPLNHAHTVRQEN
jgi:hydroxymethylpyrimidine/phosphomethylpyrimidine kinase